MFRNVISTNIGKIVKFDVINLRKSQGESKSVRKDEREGPGIPLSVTCACLVSTRPEFDSWYPKNKQEMTEVLFISLDGAGRWWREVSSYTEGC